MTQHTPNLAGLDLRAEIDRLRKDRNAIILAHYYQRPEIPDLADYIGDSLELSKKAAATDAADRDRGRAAVASEEEFGPDARDGERDGG